MRQHQQCDLGWGGGGGRGWLLLNFHKVTTVCQIYSDRSELRHTHTHTHTHTHARHLSMTIRLLMGRVPVWGEGCGGGVIRGGEGIEGD